MNVRTELVRVALEWENSFTVMPQITSAISEYDAAMLLGMSSTDYAKAMHGRTSISKGYDFSWNLLRYQVKACRPSGKRGSRITWVPSVRNYEFDRLIYIQYFLDFSMQEAWIWDVASYRTCFELRKRLSPQDMRGGMPLFLSNKDREAIVNRTVHDFDIRHFLEKVVAPLAGFLGRVLPATNRDWWKESVVSVLTPQQQQRINFQRVTALAGLDLAALLRVLDQNWSRIAESLSLAWEGRNYVKEMQAIRNKWAHLSTEPVALDDVYRDLDTLQRFCLLIEADERFVHEIKAAKTAILCGTDESVKASAAQKQTIQSSKDSAKKNTKGTSGSPHYYELFTEVLELLSDEKPRTSHEIIFELGIKMSYSATILNTMKEKDTIGWCTWHLKAAGLVDRPHRGINTITDSGKAVLGNHERITRELLKTIPAYGARIKK